MSRLAESTDVLLLQAAKPVIIKIESNKFFMILILSDTNN
jgi:hypothetical protein